MMDGILKIFKLGPFLCGVAGAACNIYTYFRWVQYCVEVGLHPLDFREGSEDYVIEHPTETQMLLVDTRDDRIYFFEADCPMAIPLTEYAIGSGSKYAQGAMATGMMAIDAVKLASRFDFNTGGQMLYVTKDHADTEYRDGLTKVLESGNQISVAG